MNKILFSGIGSSDPIRNGYDGPMLHIVRKYRPTDVYLFLTKEMVERDEKDNRYELSIKSIDESIKVYKIKTDIIEAHLFDAFINPISEALSNIENKYPDANLALNCTSGTFQYITTTILYAMSSTRKYDMCQVVTPEKKSNNIATVGKEYDVQVEIENNLNTLDDEENRMIIPNLEIFKRARLESQLKTLIERHEYAASIELIKTGGLNFNPEVINILNHGYHRSLLDFDMANRQLINKELKKNFLIKTDDEIFKLLEIFLTLQIKHKNKRYAEYILQLDPFTIDLQKQFLKKVLKFNTATITKKKSNSEIFHIEKLKSYEGLYEKIMEEYVIPQETYITVQLLNKVIEWKLKDCMDEEILEMKNVFDKLGKLKRELRNDIAHSNRGASEKDIQDKIGWSPEVLNEKLKALLKYIGKENLKEDYFNVYQKINDSIKNLF